MTLNNPVDAQRYVRITGEKNGKFIEFDFSIGDPLLYVELILPHDAFEKFCVDNNVVHLNSEQAAQVDNDRIKWRHGEPRSPITPNPARKG